MFHIIPYSAYLRQMHKPNGRNLRDRPRERPSCLLRRSTFCFSATVKALHVLEVSSAVSRIDSSRRNGSAGDTPHGMRVLRGSETPKLRAASPPSCRRHPACHILFGSRCIVDNGMVARPYLTLRMNTYYRNYRTSYRRPSRRAEKLRKKRVCNSIPAVVQFDMPVFHKLCLG